jgi:small subunit ribosomal protein S8
MSMSDPIADMLTRIRNGNTAKHDFIEVPTSKVKLAIVEILAN